MKTELVKLNVNQYDIGEKKANEIKSLYMPMIGMLEDFEGDFNELVSKEFSTEQAVQARNLRLEIKKVRISADKARKSAKEEFLRANKAIQGAYNTLEYAVKSKEEKLLAIENHAKNLELERIAKLQEQRLSEITEFVDENAILPELGSMSEGVWTAFLLGTKQSFFDKIEAEKEAEKQRIEAEKAERKRIADIEKENKRLAKEAKKKERLAEIERKKREEAEKLRIKTEKKEKQRLAKIEAEKEKQRQIETEKQAEILKKAEAEKQRIADELAKQKEAEKQRILAEQKEKERLAEIEKQRLEQIEAKKQAELNKNDAQKVLDLISDLTNLKTKYTFKSKKNQKKYNDTGILIDKVIAHIKK